MNAFTLVEVSQDKSDEEERLKLNQERMREYEADMLEHRRTMGNVAFARLPFAVRRSLAGAALRAHPENKEHRARWIKARRTLDMEGLPVRVAVGGGIGQVRAVSELSRWEKAARAVC